MLQRDRQRRKDVTKAHRGNGCKVHQGGPALFDGEADVVLEVVAAHDPAAAVRKHKHIYASIHT